MIYSQLLHSLNYATALRNTLIVVLALGLGPMSWAAGSESGGNSNAAATSVNINTADAQTLAAGLTGIGPSRAEDIVRYREAYGPFASIEELMEVKGVGKSTIDKNRKVLTLE